MGINFNIVKKPKKDEDEEELEEKDFDNDEDIKTSSYDAKRRMFKFMGIIVGIMIIVLIILFIASLGNGNKKVVYSYSKIESIMEQAAKSYFKDHLDYLPSDEDSIIEVDAVNLAAEGKMQDLSAYTEDGVVCTGSVEVQMKGSKYVYTPILDCGDSYSTISLSTKILEDNEIVTSGYGLYSNNGNYVFRGEISNNYVKLDNSLWRIVKINSNNNVVLINVEGAGYSHPWDNRYNIDMKYEAGINNYSASRAREFLDKVYDDPDEKKNENILSAKDKTKLVEFSLCVGKRSTTSEEKDNSRECRETLKNQKLGLLTLSDYLYASVDPNCKNSTTKSCKNYNYLTNKSNWWLVTADSDSSSRVYKVSSNGAVLADYASNYAMLRPVIYLSDNVMFKSGNGSLEKPYKTR